MVGEEGETVPAESHTDGVEEGGGDKQGQQQQQGGFAWGQVSGDELD